MPSNRTLLEKAKKAKEIESLINQYKVIGAASLQKVRGAQLQELRKKLQDSAFLRVTKNSAMKRAIAGCKDKPELKKFEERLSGPNIFLFTNINPFKLVLLLQKNKVKTIARAGDVAAHDVVVPAGNTGLPPGPVISQFNAVGLPTRIESGSVWISRDSMVAKKGEAITARTAAVLSKLGIKTVEIGLTINVVYDDGIVIAEEQLSLDLEETQRSVGEAYTRALNLSLNAAYPLPENAAMLLQTVQHKAFNLALSAGIPAKGAVVFLVKKAYLEMLSLSSEVAKINGRAVDIQKS